MRFTDFEKCSKRQYLSSICHIFTCTDVELLNEGTDGEKNEVKISEKV